MPSVPWNEDRQGGIWECTMMMSRNILLATQNWLCMSFWKTKFHTNSIQPCLNQASKFFKCSICHKAWFNPELQQPEFLFSHSFRMLSGFIVAQRNETKRKENFTYLHCTIPVGTKTTQRREISVTGSKAIWGGGCRKETREERQKKRLRLE